MVILYWFWYTLVSVFLIEKPIRYKMCNRLKLSIYAIFNRYLFIWKYKRKKRMAHRNSKRLHVHHLLFINQHWNSKRYMNQWNNSYFTCFGGALRQQRGINKKRSSDIPQINIINWFCLCLLIVAIRRREWGL